MARILFPWALTLLFSGIVSAQPFALDSTFASNGYFISTMPGWDQASDVTVQPDCKIVTAGHVGTFFNGTCVVSRFLPNGAYDPSFGVNGIASFTLTTGNDQLNVVRLQPDGKIVVAGGRLNGALGVARLLPNGTLDLSFGTGGKVVFPASTPILDAPATGLAIMPDGKILVGTKSDASNGQSDNASVILRLMPDGALDTSFANNGKLFLNIFSGLHELIDVLLLQNDGKIFFAARHFAAVNPSPPVLVRLLSDGTPDPSFGNDGFAPMIVGVQFYDVKILPDEKILGLLYFDFHTFLTRFNPNGSLDLDFGTNGMINLDPSFPVNVGGYNLIIQDDDKIGVAGTQSSLNSSPTPPYSFYVARFDPDGSRDSTFAPDGQLFPDPEGSGEILNGFAQHGTGFVGVGASKNALNQTDLVTYRLTNGVAPSPPASGFIATTNGLTATFINTSTGATDFLWDFGDGQISSLAEPEHTYASSGDYNVKLTAYNKCVAAESVQTITVSTTSINEAFEKNGFSVFPNPNNGSFTLKLNRAISGRIKCCLINSIGQVVGCQTIFHDQGDSQFQINFGTAPPPGLYTLNLSSINWSNAMPVVIIR